MRQRLVAGSVVLLLVVGGCGSSRDDSSGEAAPTVNVSASAPTELGTITKSGFGQSDEYVWVTAVVHNNSDYVGQTVTVNFNVLDDAGTILKSESQVEHFSLPQGDHIIGTQVSLVPGEKAAKVEATLLVEASGAFSDQPFPAISAVDPTVAKDEYGGHTFSFVLENPLSQPLKSPRIQAMCMDSSGAINGGGSDYPDLVPANGKVKVDVHIIASGDPASCDVFVGPPTFEDSDSGNAASAAPVPAAGSAEDAFHVWVDQFAAKNWPAQYQTLVGAQQSLISEAEFIACRESEQTPHITWSKALSAVQVPDFTIPGSSAAATTTKVTAELELEGLKVPIDAHMIDEDGVWKWSLNPEALTKCGK